ncbi:MAG: Ditrans,polycis-undecaprenyl-diphosphate synthase ((2E,6E)-farnesyl-diphosphate specific) [Pelotomaculum sp. PtaB.Bin013]|uniref:Polyprenyl diphosphate synthase n=1 Tax=Pelotomaculum isophthalicicum JI TaxID=947010 RepID=A0A9X4JUI7_9FIRM|nr:polyprenyl diphosphate synthase [Pelotomaculum isophthalicicum]MDF9409340.1 polyprenyl diphosphate synthase [Pelotomaculum isophthalicicum JI]OPX91835.1 MAG: Ditrans,polycis-undecaprenyl-diphosphate synthase ((2E,6E)-farnesyl-diphosphate specific) [Pelotomaculum sp. PtaB.Bin013]
MSQLKFRRLPKHIGIIPDGNRRWAVQNGLPKEAGYEKGLEPGLRLYEICKSIGIKELTFYGFTQDNTKRPSVQRIAFQQACIKAVNMFVNKDGSLLVIGDFYSPLFPPELIPYTKRRTFGNDAIRINFLVNYGWKWDLNHLTNYDSTSDNISTRNFLESIASADISRVDLIIRWGGRRRLSGFLPVQSIYADFYVVDELWPDFRPEHLYDALNWYETQDITLGG